MYVRMKYAIGFSIQNGKELGCVLVNQLMLHIVLCGASELSRLIRLYKIPTKRPMAHCSTKNSPESTITPVVSRVIQKILRNLPSPQLYLVLYRNSLESTIIPVVSRVVSLHYSVAGS